MRKIIGLLMVLSILLLAACGGGNNNLSVQEVLNQSIQATESLESYAADMVIDTEIMEMEVNMEATADITHDPDTMYMDMTMGMTGFSMDVEVYAAEEAVYMSMFGEWLEMDEEEMELENFDQLMEEDFSKLRNFEEQFEMIEEDDRYILTLSGEGEMFEELIENYIEASFGDLTMDSMMEDEYALEFSVNQLDMELIVDKDAMYIISQTVDAEVEIDGETTQLRAESTISTISAMNEVEPIKIPEEVIENAVQEEFFEEESGFIEEPMTLEEIQEVANYTIPQINNIPEEYEMTETYYDEYSDMTSIFYEKDFEHLLALSVFPSREAYGEMYIVGETETVSVNGNEALLEIMEENYMFLTWDHEDVFIELITEGPEMTKERFLEIAESIE